MESRAVAKKSLFIRKNGQRFVVRKVPVKLLIVQPATVVSSGVPMFADRCL